MKCIIVEDNIQDLELLSWYIKQQGDLELKQCFTNGLEAISYINDYKPRLIFSDIDMPVIKGIDLYKKLQYNPICIFVTAYSEYALESYESQAFDFMLKPVTEERFLRCMARVREYESLKTRAGLYDTMFEEKSISIKDGLSTYKIPLSEIMYIEALNDYTKVVTANRKYITLSKLKHFLDRLPQGEFLRVHRSYAVAKKAIQKIAGNEIFIDKQVLPIGKTFKPTLKAELNF